jgi:RND family efflux transporter MFP subunit
MKRFCWSVFSVIVILTVSTPVFAASQKTVSSQKTVTASAVIVPAQVSELGFVISGIAKEIPVKEGDAVKAGQTLVVLDTPELQFAVAEAQAGLRAAQAEAEIRRNDVIRKFIINYQKLTVRKLRLSVPHEVIEMADGNVQRARASVQIAEANLAQGTLTAPFDGIVTSLHVIPGEFVPSDQAVMTLATLDALQIETTDLRERDVPNIHMGDPANIFIEALNQNISGKVIRVAPRADIIGGDVVFKVTIAPDIQPEGLLWGMTAEVEIQSRK